MKAQALVTGGTRGIGFAVCKLLSEQGYAVTALYSESEKDAEAARGALPQVNFVKADVGDESAVERVFERIGEVDVLVNNAARSLFSQIQDTTTAQWQDLFSVNVNGAFYCARRAAKGMIGRGAGGAIVNISSVWGQTGGSCESAYSATKGALIAFTKALAKELAPCGIRVNCVAPGVIDTEMNARLSVEDRAALCEEIPLGRMGSAEEVARAVLFLIENGYVTGEVLSVNGGFYI